MANWYLNRALTNFRNEVNARWPNRDKASDGTIGDLAHQATKSDHNPDPDGSVDAWDIDVELNGAGKPYKDDLWVLINAALKHEATQYVIYDRRITSRTWGLGVWRAYDGPSPHEEHVHISTRDSYENSTKPWLPKEESVALTNDDIPVIRAALHGCQIGKSTDTFGLVLDRLRSYDADVDALKADHAAVKAELAGVKAAVTELATKPAAAVTVDKATLAAALQDPAFLAAVATAVADENARRQAS